MPEPQRYGDILTLTAGKHTTVTLPDRPNCRGETTIGAKSGYTVTVEGPGLEPLHRASGQTVTVEPVAVEQPGDRRGRPTGTAWRVVRLGSVEVFRVGEPEETG